MGEKDELRRLLDDFEHDCFMLRVEASETRSKDEDVREAYERIREESTQAIAATLSVANVDDALAILDEIREADRISYDDYSQLHDAIVATISVSECENVAPDYLDFLCSKCGFVHYHSDENDTGDGNDWAYCPQCGKAVKQCAS